MLLHNLIEHRNNYSKTSESLLQYYRYQPALNNSGNIIDFPANNSNSILFKFKEK